MKEPFLANSSLLLLICCSLIGHAVVDGYMILPSANLRSSSSSLSLQSRERSILSASSHSEFSVLNDDGEEDNDTVPIDTSKTDLMIPNEDVAQFRQQEYVPDRNHFVGETQLRRNHQVLEYGALRPGTVCRIQVGDIGLARKAWKKRRRSGSPLLVPCSILDIDRRSMVRWNLLFLMEKFGRATKAGIEVSVAELATKYRFYLKSSLERQVQDLGYTSKNEMMTDLFNPRVQESYGVQLVERQLGDENASNFDKMLYLEAPISRLKGQSRTKNTPLLQFRLSEPETADGEQTLVHTGYIRAVKDSTSSTDDNDDGHGDAQQRLNRVYTFLPLSAALRVSQKDEVEISMVEQGKIYTAAVFDYAKIGDGGSPLLTLSLNPGGVRDNLKMKPDKRYSQVSTAASQKKPNFTIEDLKVGSGPYRAKVVKINAGQRALVDLNGLMGSLHYRDAMLPASWKPGNQPRKQNTVTPLMDFSDEEIDGDDDDLEELIAASIDDLDVLDDDDNDDYDVEDDDDDDFEDSDTVYEGDGGSNDIVDELLALRSKDSFEDGLFEEGETEEDLSHLFELDENGNLLYNDNGSLKVANGNSVIADNDAIDEPGELDQDISEDEDDFVDEDLSQLFTENSDGSFTFRDSETGEEMIIDKNDPSFEDLKVMKSLIDDDAARRKSEPKTGTKTTPKTRFVSKKLQLGDIVDVYILSISKQSRQFKVTTNPLVQGREAKDLKREGDVRKKKHRLKRSLGGSFKRIDAMKGQEVNGVVKATSKNWVYVQPESEANLPVGIASMDKELIGLAKGDSVRVKIAGIDDERGQLSLKLISKRLP